MADADAVALIARELTRRRVPEEAGIIVALAVIVAVIASSQPGFLAFANVLELLRGASFFGLMAVGMVFVLVHGDVDISIGSVYFLSAIATALTVSAGLDPWIAAVVGVGCGVGLGLLNGVLSILLGVPVLIVSLGTLSVYRGLGLALSTAGAVNVPDSAGGLFFLLARHVAVPIALFVGAAVAGQVLLTRSRFGYQLRCIGSNVIAARLAGIRVNRARLQALALMGGLAGITGALTIGFFRAADSSVGVGYELLVISAVIIGGTPLFGGSGTVFGAVVGVLIIATISGGIARLGVGPEWSTFVTGGVILVAISIDRLLRGARTRALVSGLRRGRHLVAP